MLVPFRVPNGEWAWGNMDMGKGEEVRAIGAEGATPTCCPVGGEAWARGVVTFLQDTLSTLCVLLQLLVFVQHHPVPSGGQLAQMSRLSLARYDGGGLGQVCRRQARCTGGALLTYVRGKL